MRWNKDRGAAVTRAGSSTYDSRLLCAINELGENVLGIAVNTMFSFPNKYTGTVLSLEVKNIFQLLLVKKTFFQFFNFHR